MSYQDIRIRTSNKCTPIPPKCKAYVFRYNALDTFVYKVVIAPSLMVANQRIRDFTTENELDFFWQFVSEDDFEFVYFDNQIPG